MLRRLCAELLIAAVLTPFAVSLAAVDLSWFDDSPSEYAAPFSPALPTHTAVEAAGSVAPPVQTRQERLRIDVSPEYAGAVLDRMPAASMRPLRRISSSRRSSLIELRL